MYASYLFTKILINLSFLLIISTHSYETLLERKHNFVLMFFKIVFLGLRLLSLHTHTHTHIHTHTHTHTHLKHNASLTHVTSFRLMTPKPVGLSALGVETPLRA